MAHKSKTFQSIHIYHKKVKNPPDGFCTSLLFASAIILICGVILLHGISRILKVKLSYISFTTTGLKRITHNQTNTVGKQEIILPKSTPKIYPFSTVKFQRVGYSTYSPQEWNTHNIFNFTLMVQQR